MESENSSNEGDLMPQLLPVKGKPMAYDANNEPQNANDYLRTVQWEALHFPKITVSQSAYALLEQEDSKQQQYKISENSDNYSFFLDYFGKNENKDNYHNLSVPWKKKIIRDFEKLKENIELSKESIIKNKIKIDNVLSNIQEGIINPYQFVKNQDIFMKNFKEQDQNQQFSPSISFLIYIDENLIYKICQSVANYLKYQRNGKFLLSEHQFQWIYSLFGLIEKPLLQDSAGIINEVIKYVLKSLALYTDFQDEAARTEYEIMVNILLILAIEYFEQKYFL